MNCPNCNKPVEGTSFCSYCGYKMPSEAEDVQATETAQANENVQTANAAQDAEPTVVDGACETTQEGQAPIKPKMPRKKLILTALISAAVLVAAGAIAFVLYFTNDKVTFSSGLNNIDDALASNELIGYAIDTFTGAHVTVDIESLEDGYGNVYWDQPIHMEYAVSENMLALCTQSGGDSLGIYMENDPGTIILELNDNAIGLVFEEFAEKFEDSIFAPDSDSEYALPLTKDNLEMLEEMFASLSEGTDEDMEEAQEYVDEYAELIIDLIWEYGEVESGSGTVTVVLDGEALANIIGDFLLELSQDEDLFEYLDTVMESEGMAEILMNVYRVNPGYMEDIDWQEYLEDALETYDEYIRESIEDMDFELSVSVTTSFLNDFESLEIAMEIEGETIELLLEIDGNNILFTAESDYDKFEFALNETDDGWECYAEEDGDTLFFVELVTDGEEYTLTAEADEGYMVISVEGTYEKDGDDLSFTVSTIEYKEGSHEEVMKFELAVAIDIGGTMDIPDYDNVFDMSEKDFEKFFEKFIGLTQKNEASY